jgi:hypothetical protein
LTSVRAAFSQIYQILDKQHEVRAPGYREYSISPRLAQVQKTDSFLGGLTLFTLGIASSVSSPPC